MKLPELKGKDTFYSDIETRIEKIKSKKNLYIILYRITRIVVFIAGASITILTGWGKIGCINFSPEKYILVVSSFITVLAAIEGLFSFRDKGKNNDILLFDLRKLRDKICFDYLKSPDIYEQNKDLYFKEYQEIMEAQRAVIENTYNDD